MGSEVNYTITVLEQAMQSDVPHGCRWKLYLPHEEGWSVRKKEGSKARQARQMLFIVMPMASIDPPVRGATVVATQLAATDCSAAGKHMYYHRKMLSTKLAVTVLLALLTFFHAGSADRPANRGIPGPAAAGS